MPLDCVRNHSVFVYDRGGNRRIGEITKIARVKWGRIRDGISEAEIDVSSANCDEQASFFDSIEPGRHEFKVFRGGEPVWEGPITREKITSAGSSFFARDVMHYTYRTAIHAKHSAAYPNIKYVTALANEIVTTEMNRKENEELAAYPDLPHYEFTNHIVEHHLPTDAQTSKVIEAFSNTVFEAVDYMAQKNGMDYTVLGRALHLWDTSMPLGWAARVTDSDFLGPIDVTRYGMELATRGISSDGQGNAGIAGGVDPYYGLVEFLTTVYDENEDSGPPPTQAELNSQAARNISGRNPTPVIINVPDGSSLNPKGVISMSDLVPGVYFPLTTVKNGRTYSQTQKLSKVDVIETSKGETITVTMGPASAPDEAEEE